MSRSRVLAMLTTLATAAVPAVAAARSSSVNFWKGLSGKVVCGVEKHPGTPAKWLLCGAAGIPEAKQGAGVPFVRIAGTGSPQLVLISKYSFVGNRQTALKQGAVWSSLGVTCSIGARTVRCKNHSGHGFTTGNGKYKAF